VSEGDLNARLEAVASLGEPVRRALYCYVIAQPEPVSRDQAALGAGVAHHVAKFHLDRLAEDGLLEVEFRRPPGRGGPGAGRPAKLYRRADRQLEVSLPERRYDLAGHLLAQAVTTAERDGVPVARALEQAADEAGQALGVEARRRAGRRPSRRKVVAAATDVLEEQGYEPRQDGEGITLANCPFHDLARDYTDLVCGMNLALLRGLVAGLDVDRLDATLQPAPARCCVRLVDTA
jgi:predicted ArsR family transcriptional regulator